MINSRKHWTKRVVPVLLLILIVSATSVAAYAAEKVPTIPFPTENITLRFTWWGNQVRHERTQAIVDLFCKIHPNVTIETEYLPGNEYNDKLLTFMVAGQTPDIFQTEYDYISQWNDSGLVESFEPYIEAGIINIDDCIALDSLRHNGELYGHNLGLNGPSIMYDINLLKENNIEINPNQPWTWDDFIRVGREVYEKTGVQTSFHITFNMTDWLRCSARNEGLYLFNGDTALGISDAEILRRAYKTIETAYKEGWGLPGEAYAGISSVEQQPIVSGRSWNASLTSNMIIGLQKAIGPDRPIGFMMIPDHAGYKESGQYLKPAMTICISSTAPEANKIAAAYFIDWMVSSAEANEILLGERGVPCNTKVLEALVPVVDDPTRRTFEFVNLAGKYAGPLDPKDPVWLPEMNDTSKNLAQRCYFGEIDADEAARLWLLKAEELISRFK